MVLVACAEVESNLYVDAQGPANSNGTIDRGWLQIYRRNVGPLSQGAVLVRETK